jgi:hypothetical protein
MNARPCRDECAVVPKVGLGILGGRELSSLKEKP